MRLMVTSTPSPHKKNQFSISWFSISFIFRPFSLFSYFLILFCPNPSTPKPLENAVKLGCGLAIPIDRVRERLREWQVIVK